MLRSPPSHAGCIVAIARTVLAQVAAVVEGVMCHIFMTAGVATAVGDR